MTPLEDIKNKCDELSSAISSFDIEARNFTSKLTWLGGLNQTERYEEIVRDFENRLNWVKDQIPKLEASRLI